MNINARIKIPCTITHVTEGPEDVYGDPTTVSTTRDAKTFYVQDQRSEKSGDTTVASERGTCYFQPAEALATADQVTFQGRTYEIFGEPWNAVDPFSGLTYIQATVARTA